MQIYETDFWCLSRMEVKLPNEHTWFLSHTFSESRLVFLVLIILLISYNALLCKKTPLLKQFEAHEITFDHIVWEFAYSFGRALSYNYCLHVTLDWSAQNGDEQILQWLETHNKVMLTEDLFHLSPAYNYNRCKFFNVS